MSLSPTHRNVTSSQCSRCRWVGISSFVRAPTAAKSKTVPLCTVGIITIVIVAAILWPRGSLIDTFYTYHNHSHVYFANDAAQQQQERKLSGHVRDITTNNTIILLMGMPKSGNDAIHAFLQCMRPDWIILGEQDCTSTITTQSSSSSSNSNKKKKKKHTMHRRDKKKGRSLQEVEKTTTTTESTNKNCAICLHNNLIHERPAFTNCSTIRPTSATTTTTSHPNTYVYTHLDSVTQEPYAWFLPQHFALSLLHHDYPDAIWILNKRETIPWAINVLHWYSTTVRLFHSFHIPYYNFDDDRTTKISSILQQPITENRLYQELEYSWNRAKNSTDHHRRQKELEQIYENHTQTVQRFATKYHTAHPLIEINVDAMEVYQTLSTALRLDNNNDHQAKAKACWTYNAETLDNDWLDLTLHV